MKNHNEQFNEWLSTAEGQACLEQGYGNHLNRERDKQNQIRALHIAWLQGYRAGLKEGERIVREAAQ